MEIRIGVALVRWSEDERTKNRPSVCQETDRPSGDEKDDGPSRAQQHFWGEAINLFHPWRTFDLDQLFSIMNPSLASRKYNKCQCHIALQL